jgi:hypothetical protein
MRSLSNSEFISANITLVPAAIRPSTAVAPRPEAPPGSEKPYLEYPKHGLSKTSQGLCKRSALKQAQPDPFGIIFISLIGPDNGRSSQSG